MEALFVSLKTGNHLQVFFNRGVITSTTPPACEHHAAVKEDRMLRDGPAGRDLPHVLFS